MHSWERPSLADLDPSSRRLPLGKSSMSRCGNFDDQCDNMIEIGDWTKVNNIITEEDRKITEEGSPAQNVLKN